MLGGEEMLSCTGVTSPGCAAGGNYASRIKSYNRQFYDSATSTWTITQRGGTQLIYKPVEEWVASGGFDQNEPDEVRQVRDTLWLLAEVMDVQTNTNIVTYSYTISSAADGF